MTDAQEDRYEKALEAMHHAADAWFREHPFLAALGVRSVVLESRSERESGATLREAYAAWGGDCG